MSGSPDYAEYRREKMAEGNAFEDFVHDLLWKRGIGFVQFRSTVFQYERGENTGGVETKFDAKFSQTGNLYIEIAEKADPSRPRYTESGIYRSDNGWLYAIGDYSRVFVFSKTMLKLLHESGKYRAVETPTSRAFLLPLRRAEQCAALILCVEVLPHYLGEAFAT